jgi:hypothetical protein
MCQVRVHLTSVCKCSSKNTAGRLSAVNAIAAAERKPLPEGLGGIVLC